MFGVPENIGKDDKTGGPKKCISEDPYEQPSKEIEQISVEHLKRKIKNILDEYLNDCYTVSYCDDDIRSTVPRSALPKLVSEGYLCVLERSKTARLGAGGLFSHLILRATLSIDYYCIGLEEVLSQADDLAIDIPQIWLYLAEIIAPVTYENSVPLTRLHEAFDIIIKQNHAAKLLGPLFKLVITEKGPKHLYSLWQSSGHSFSDFMPSSAVDSFVEEYQFEFLLGDPSLVVNKCKLDCEEIHDKLLELFAKDITLDDIFVWIHRNVGVMIRDRQFVRALSTAIFEDSIVNMKVKTENLQRHYSLLIRIIDGRLDFELECLYALQALVTKLEHPQGVLLTTCGLLYDDNVFSPDSFVRWRTSDNPAEQKGKRIAINQLTSFFKQLHENASEDDED